MADIARYIVETTKKIIETILSDIENKISFFQMFPKIDFKFNETKREKDYRKFNLELFENSDEYYKDLVLYFNYHLECFYFKMSIKTHFDQSSFATIYFSVLTDLLLDVLKIEDAYKEDIIKCDITTLCQIFAQKNERLNYSHSFFYICANELDEKYYGGKKNYTLKKNKFIKQMDEYYKNDALKKLNAMKSNLYEYIQEGFYDFYMLKKNEHINNNENDLDNYIKDCKIIKNIYNYFISNYQELINNSSNTI